MFFFTRIVPLLSLWLLRVRAQTFVTETYKVCVVEPCQDGDSAPAIEEAFNVCGRNPTGRGKVVFLNETYNVQSVMNTTYLENVDVDLRGTLLWDTNISYWLNNSLPVGYQNQSSAWLFGGANINWQGHGYGTLDGNGQVWYDYNANRSNLARRPHAITIRNTTNSVFAGIRFVQSQMWTMTVISSENVLLQDIYVNSTSNSSASTDNTDGADTIYANNITFRGWTVVNGDDSISPKANSTNILVEDSVFYNGNGVAIGSIGQYNNTFEYIQNVTARNITFYNTGQTAYIKTWTGTPKGYPPNGGGGGIGFASNLLFHDFVVTAPGAVFAITQCTSYNGQAGGCDTSKFNIHNVTVDGISGTVETDVVASLQCSGDSPCYGIDIKNINLLDKVNGTRPQQYLCSHVSAEGFDCTGPIVEENDQ